MWTRVHRIKIDKYNCIICNEGKQTKMSFPQKGTRASNVLEIVHADVCGPMEERSIGGTKYFLVLEDDFSRMSFVYFLKNKDEVFDKFTEFKNMVENQTESKIKIFRTDNGREFCTSNFKRFLKDYGIIYQTTNPYKPEQNDSSERMNRTLIERATRCLLFDAKLEKNF